MFSMLSEMGSHGVTNIETDYHRYSQTGSECRVRNINGRAMLPDSTVNKLQNTITTSYDQQFQMDTHLMYMCNNIVTKFSVAKFTSFIRARE